MSRREFIIAEDALNGSSSAIINSLLDILLYQRFYDGSKYVRTHILALYLSANEEPRLYEQLTFFDRSAIRIISQRLGWEEMIDVLGTPQRAIDSSPRLAPLFPTSCGRGSYPTPS